jgi:hypothetical protein
MAEHVSLPIVPVCTLSTHLGSKGRILHSRVFIVLLR